MNYSLGFPDLSRELSISPKQSLEAVVSDFRSKHLEADSAVRAIHHQPAAEGTFTDIPALVHPTLWSSRGTRHVARFHSQKEYALDQREAGKPDFLRTTTGRGKDL